MNYEEIMQKVASGLTGQPEADTKYLHEQMKEYKTHELAQEIIRGIGRMVFEIIPAEKREELDRLMKNHHLGIDTAIEEAEFQIHKRNYDRALEILESIIKKNEDENGELIMCRDDTVSEYHCFRNIFEEILYKEMFKPERTVRQMTENYGHLYFIYGSLLFELKRYDEAKVVLKKSISINPINAEAIFELAEISKLNGEWDSFIDLTKRCLSVAYSSQNISRCYRNFGYYFIEEQKFSEATALYYLSMHFDPQATIAQSQLMYIQQVTGKQPSPPSSDELKELFKQYDIQSGANELVLEIAATLGRSTKEQGHYDAARFFLSIAYDLTSDDTVKSWIDSLPKSNSEE